MNRFQWIKLGLLSVMVLLAAAVGAQPVPWAVNGHYYLPVSVPGGVSWTEAQNAALDLGGHLATLTSAEENAFVFGLIDDPLFWNQEPGGSDLGPWLGGFQTSDDGSTPNANWIWVTSEPWIYTNWHPGEPNNWTGADEDYLSFKCHATPGCRSPLWNDLPDAISQLGTAVIAYVVEFEGPTDVPGHLGKGPVLHQNTPNPFNPVTVITFELEADGRATLDLFDQRGRLIRNLLTGNREAGHHEVTLRADDLASGVYFYRLKVGTTTRVRRMALVR